MDQPGPWEPDSEEEEDSEEDSEEEEEEEVDETSRPTTLGRGHGTYARKVNKNP